MLDERHAQDEQFVERFRREAKSAAVLSHPNIVAVYDRGESDGTYYIAMEYLEGKTLKELLVARGPTPIRVAVDYARQILAALEFAHRNGIVHRDIKPHNIVVGPDGRLKVMDFGIARSASSQVTEAGSIIGTAQYLSPEQARGAAAGPAADLYSTGVVLYEMLTGSVPFAGDTPLEVAMKHISAIPEPPSAKRPEIPARARRRRPAGAREGPGAALRERTGDGRRPRARRRRAFGFPRHRGGGHVGAQGRGGGHGGHASWRLRRSRHATRLHADREPLLRVRAASQAPPDLALAARGTPARGGRRSRPTTSTPRSTSSWPAQARSRCRSSRGSSRSSPSRRSRTPG